jgi:DNA-binding IclR family transcriptional regulator
MLTNKSKKLVPGANSSRKLLHALLCFTEARPFWSVPELAHVLELSITSTYRYVALLREVGLLEGAPEGAYRVAGLVLSLAAACQASRPPLADIARPFLARIRDEIDETVLIATRSGDAAYCVERVESRRQVRLQFDRGQAMTLHRGSMARILLAAMSKKELQRYFANLVDTPEPALAAQLTEGVLRATLEQGWTESFEEIDEGIWGAAAAITHNGMTIASIGLAAPIYRVDKERRDNIIMLVRDAGEQISALLDSY